MKIYLNIIEPVEGGVVGWVVDALSTTGCLPFSVGLVEGLPLVGAAVEADRVVFVL